MAISRTIVATDAECESQEASAAADLEDPLSDSATAHPVPEPTRPLPSEPASA